MILADRHESAASQQPEKGARVPVGSCLVPVADGRTAMEEITARS